MNFTKKFDRAFQWAGEKMGSEARTATSEEFKELETEMALRFDGPSLSLSFNAVFTTTTPSMSAAADETSCSPGMVKLQMTMNAYIKWLAYRETLLGEKGAPAAVMGRSMIAHGEDFDPDSQFGNCLIEMGRANEQLAQVQEQYAADSTKYWLESVERSVATMKEYQVRSLPLCTSTSRQLDLPRVNSPFSA